MFHFDDKYFIKLEIPISFQDKNNIILKLSNISIELKKVVEKKIDNTESINKFKILYASLDRLERKYQIVSRLFHTKRL